MLFVHGMGSQRRYGDMSQLVEALDQRVRDTGAGEFVGIDVKLEPVRDPDAPPVAYLEARWKASGEAEPQPATRFYEAYWAPITAGGVPARQVLLWLFAQVPKPLGGLATHWRGRARLRRSVLQGLSGVSDLQRRILFRAYDGYESHSARRTYPGGHFGGFIEHLAASGRMARLSDRERGEVIAIARRWHRRCITTELSNLASLTTIAAALLVVAGLLVLTTVRLLALREGATLEGLGPASIADYIWGHKTTFGLLASMGLLIPGLASGLEAYLGDVVFWTTYEETQTRYEKRRRILTEVRGCLSHLTQHPRCGRIVVVSHSLGTAIAVDAILGLARDTRALKDAPFREHLLDLRKITHVVTYGSPIDKIHYFFERDARQHRYHRVVEDLRGDIGTEPFGNNQGNRFIHWVNFWDRADLISGALESPSNRRHPNVRVDNVEVSHGPIVNPIQAHTGYLDLPDVLDTLLEVILRRNTEHRTPPGVAPFGPGTPHRSAAWQLRIAMLGVWALVILFAGCAIQGRLGLAAATTAAIAGVALLAVALAAWPSARASLAVAFESARALLHR